MRLLKKMIKISEREQIICIFKAKYRVKKTEKRHNQIEQCPLNEGIFSRTCLKKREKVTSPQRNILRSRKPHTPHEQGDNIFC